MKISRKTLSAVLLLGASALLFSDPAQGQFLKKLSKGLQKVNETLEKVEKATKQTTSNSPSTTSANKASTSNKSAAASADWKDWKAPVRTPYITSKTKFMKVESNNDFYISNVHSGIFAVKRGNLFEFWRVDGKKLFNAEWEFCSNPAKYNFPEFRGGVAVARRSTPNATGKKVICLLYANGAVKELDPSYETVSQFVDGLALAKQNLGNWKYKYYFLNTRGEKVFTTLDVDAGYSNWIRPLHDGLRAYKTTSGKWGFIDASGVVKIQPKYKDVRDFSEGVAWVYEESRNGSEYVRSHKLIDTKGNTVYTAPADLQYESLSSKFGDVHDGRFFLILNRMVSYFNLKGEQLASFDAGINFYDRYTFVNPGDNSIFNINAYVADTDFNIVRQMSDKVVNGADIATGFTFEPFGLATVGFSNVISPDGDLLITTFMDVKTNTYVDNFGQFDEDGYAFVQRILIDQKEYSGFMRPDAHLDWIFTVDGTGSFSGWPLPPPIEPIDSAGFNDPPGDLPPVDPNDPPIGPKKVTAQKYTVTVKASPAEGGKVALSAAGPFNYGDYVSYSATPNKDWGISGIDYKVDGMSISPEPGERFAVTADMTITVNFYKEPKIDQPVDNGALQGSMLWIMNQEFPIDVTYYAEISTTPNISTPYGNNTYGYIVPMIDPDKVIEGKGVSAKGLILPMRINGYQKEADGKEYLVLNGGQVMLNDVKVGYNDLVMNLWVTMLMNINGFDHPQLDPNLYRLEIASRGEDGTITLGDLEVFSPIAGVWLKGGDKSFKKQEKGFMMTKTTYSLPVDIFRGVEMKPAAKRNDVLWTPPASWCEKEGLFEALKKAFNSQYQKL